MSKDTDVVHGENAQMSKKDRYGWNDDPGNFGQFRVIDKNELRIPTSSYQRAAASHSAERKVRKIASEFSWVAFQVLTVAERDNELYVMDGGHRLRAALRRSDVTVVPCLVFRSEDEREEAKSYNAVNSERKPMSAVDRHRAQLVAEDQIAQKVQRYVDESGRIVSQSAGPNTVGCINDMKRMIQKNENAFANIWKIAISVSEGEKLPKSILDGLFYLECHASEPPSSPRIKKKILDLGYNRLKTAASEGAGFYGSNVAAAFADGMMKAINKGFHRKIKIDE